MTTQLDKSLKRELIIGGKPYTLTISPDAMHLVPKGRRKGYELAWVDLVSGDAALAAALNASVSRGPKWQPEKSAKVPAKPQATRSRRKRAKP